MDTSYIKAAVDMLVATNRYAELKSELRDLIKRRDVMPRSFDLELTPLNTLIDLYEKSEAAFANVIELIEKRRAESPQTSKSDYMRDYMRMRRARENLALKIEELERGAPMTPTARRNFKKSQMDQWMKARDAHIASQGEMTWSEKNDVVMQFWERIDKQLDERYAQTMVELSRKGRRKR